MKVIFKIAIMLTFGILTGCTFSEYQSTDAATSTYDSEVTAEWKCSDYVYGGKTIVIAQILLGDIDDPVAKYTAVGRIKTHGIVKRALYREHGISHRWDFDINVEESDFDASFVIDPDGTGKYFYFGSNDTAKPSVLSKCRKTK